MRAICTALTWPQRQMHHYLALNDMITNYFSPENHMVVYHMRSVFIFVAECLALSLMLSYQAGLFAAEDSVRGVRGDNLSVQPITALAPNHCHCWTQLLVSARVWRWWGAPETLGSYSWLRKRKEVFFMPSCGDGRHVGSPLCRHQRLPLKNPCPYSRYPWLCGAENDCFFPSVPHFRVDAGHLWLFCFLVYDFFFSFQFPRAERWLCECWRATGSSVRNWIPLKKLDF